MARRSAAGSVPRYFIVDQKFSEIPTARRDEIINEVQQNYVARLNSVKAQVDNLTLEQRREFNQTLATMLEQISFSRNKNE